MISTKRGQLVNELMAVAGENLKNFSQSHFLKIRQNVKIATNAILYCGLPPVFNHAFLRSHTPTSLRVIAIVFVRVCGRACVLLCVW